MRWKLISCPPAPPHPNPSNPEGASFSAGLDLVLAWTSGSSPGTPVPSPVTLGKNDCSFSKPVFLLQNHRIKAGMLGISQILCGKQQHIVGARSRRRTVLLLAALSSQGAATKLRGTGTHVVVGGQPPPPRAPRAVWEAGRSFCPESGRLLHPAPLSRARTLNLQGFLPAGRKSARTETGWLYPSVGAGGGWER